MKLLKSAFLFAVMLSVLLLFVLFILCDVYTDSQLIVLKHSSHNTSLIIPQDLLKEHSTNTSKNFTKNISINMLSNHRSKQETIVAILLTFPEEILYNNNTLTNTLRLRDYLDLDYWNAETNKAGIPSLETWENFVLHSTKKIILVVMPYSGPGGTYNDEIERHSPCQEAMSDFFTGTVNFFSHCSSAV